MSLVTYMLSERNLAVVTVVIVSIATKYRDAEASTIVHNSGTEAIYDTNKEPNEKIKIIDEPDYGQVQVNHLSGEIHYLPEQMGIPDSFEYELISDGMCSNLLLCPPILVLLAAVGGGISTYQNEHDYPKVSSKVSSDDFDFGDLPDSFQTIEASNGAKHVATSGVILGQLRDVDEDGIPSVFADGDDVGEADDEDGVTFHNIITGEGTIISGSIEEAYFNLEQFMVFEENNYAYNWVEIEINGSGSGYLNGWIDLNGDLEFDTDEYIVQNWQVSSGETVSVSFAVTADRDLPGIYSRFRVSDSELDSPNGLALGGEVEDYFTELQEFDYGDMPTFLSSVPRIYAHYGESLAAIVDGVYLGTQIDGELQTSSFEPVLASGDDVSGVDDEDGVTFNGLNDALFLGQNDNEIDIVVGPSGGYVYGWMDLDFDGFFQNDELIIDSTGNRLDAGLHQFIVDIPLPESPLFSGSLYSRFVITDSEPTSLNPSSTVWSSGEVEDYSTDVYYLVA